MKKKSVLIATHNNSKNNYGAVFQAFALSETIKELGHDVHFLTVLNPGDICVLKRSLVTRIKNLIVYILSIPTGAKRNLRKRKFEAFKEKTQNRVFYADKETLFKNPPQADVYLSGSDQVWNPLTLRDDFFFSFVSEDKRLISYAASMGCEQIPEKNRALFEKSIARYDAVSVREDTMVDIISTCTSKKVYQHIDPVFLVDRQKWESMAVEYKKLKYDRYIFLYLIYWDKTKTHALLRLKEETGLPLVLVTLGGLVPSYADQVIMDASPEEFLYLMKNAEMVVASSFHGVALSIVMNKPFIAVPRLNPVRIHSLLRYFELQEHDTLNLSLEKAQVDYGSICNKIKEARKASVSYLKQSIAFEKETEK